MTRKEKGEESFREAFRSIIDAHNPLSPRVAAKLAAFNERREGLGAEQKEVDRSVRLIGGDEFRLFSEFFERKTRNRQLALMGLRLRFAQDDQAEVERLLEIVHQGYGTSGRRAAQAVQCGGLLRLIKELVERGITRGEQREKANRFLDQIDSYAHFTVDIEIAPTVEALVRNRLDRNAEFYLIAGYGTAAKTARQVADQLELTYAAKYQVFRNQTHRMSFMALFMRD